MSIYLLGTIAIFAIGLYFMPFIIAWARNHRQLTAIFWTNVFFGWTIVGWCGTFIWAVIR